MPHPPWRAQQVEVIQECAQSFAGQQGTAHFFDSALNADGEQQRHQRVTLFSILRPALLSSALLRRRTNRMLKVLNMTTAKMEEGPSHSASVRNDLTWPPAERGRTPRHRPRSAQLASGLASVAARNKWPTQSVPALLDNPCWNGAHSDSKSLTTCFDRVLAVKRGSEQPVAIPLGHAGWHPCLCEAGHYLAQ